jgi:serrate RNA effector molecule
MNVDRFAMVACRGAPPPEVERMYARYREEWLRRRAHVFFDDHCHQEWFLDSYHPKRLKARTAAVAEHARLALDGFVGQLDGDNVDPTRFCLDEVAGAETDAPDIMQGSRMPSRTASVDTMMMMMMMMMDDDDNNDNEGGDAVANDGDSGRNISGGDASSSSSSQATLSRGDAIPSPTLPSNMVTPLNRADDALIARQAWARSLYVRKVPPWCNAAHLKQAFQSVCGEHCGVLAVTMGMAKRDEGFDRFAWIGFERAEQAEFALVRLQSHVITRDHASGELSFQLQLNTVHKQAKNIWRYVAAAAREPVRVERDLKQCCQLIDRLDTLHGTESSRVRERAEAIAAAAADDDDDNGSAGYTENKVALDILLAYLRHVHLFCYYCCKQFESRDALFHFCAVRHVRALPENDRDDDADDDDEALKQQKQQEEELQGSNDRDDDDDDKVEEGEHDEKEAKAKAKEKEGADERQGIDQDEAQDKSEGGEREKDALDDANGDVAMTPPPQATKGGVLDMKVEAMLSQLDRHDQITGERPVKQLLATWLPKHCEQVAPKKFECKLCSKKFVAPKFVHKHIENRHRAQLDEKVVPLIKGQFFENYMADPTKVVREFRPLHRQRGSSRGRGGHRGRSGFVDRGRGRGYGHRGRGNQRGYSRGGDHRHNQRGYNQRGYNNRGHYNRGRGNRSFSPGRGNFNKRGGLSNTAPAAPTVGREVVSYDDL